jgi:hypothetical protein
MTKIFLPTELGVKGEGSPAGIEDKHTPDVKEVHANEDPAQKEQPKFYKRIRDIDEHDLTIAEELAGVDNTRNQAAFDESPKEGEVDAAHTPKEVPNMNTSSKPSTSTKTAAKKDDSSKS